MSISEFISAEFLALANAQIDTIRDKTEAGTGTKIVSLESPKK